MIYEFYFMGCTLDLSFFIIKNEKKLKQLLDCKTSKEINNISDEILDTTMDSYNSYYFPCKLESCNLIEVFLKDLNQTNNFLCSKHISFELDYDFSYGKEISIEPQKILTCKIDNLKNEVYSRLNLDYIKGKTILVQFNHEITEHYIHFESNKKIDEIKFKKIYFNLDELIFEKTKLIVGIKIDKDVYLFDRFKTNGWLQPYLSYNIVRYGKNPLEEVELLKSFEDHHLW